MEGGMPVYITPYYNSAGLQIAVGKHSAGLAVPNADGVRKTLAAMKSEWTELPVEAMYVAAIRLYDLGLKDEAAYWFYSAQYRAKLLRALLDPAQTGSVGSPSFELTQAHNAFFQLTGEFINGYAFGDPPKLAKTVATVQAEGNTIPALKTIYPQSVFVDEKQWPARNEQINAGLIQFIEYLTNSVAEIKRQRQQAGIEGKY
jgi:hypothetical protein